MKAPLMERAQDKVGQIGESIRKTVKEVFSKAKGAVKDQRDERKSDDVRTGPEEVIDADDVVDDGIDQDVTDDRDDDIGPNADNESRSKKVFDEG